MVLYKFARALRQLAHTFSPKNRNPGNGMKSKQHGEVKSDIFLRQLQSCIFNLPQDDVCAQGQFCHHEGQVTQDRSQVCIKNSLFPSTFFHKRDQTYV